MVAIIADGSGCTCNACLTANQQKSINDLYSSYSTCHNYTVGCQCGDCVKHISGYLNTVRDNKEESKPVYNGLINNNFKNWFEGFNVGIQTEKDNDIVMSAEQWELLHQKIKAL